MNHNATSRALRSGTWQPYVPRVGVSTGCRSGPRNDAETYSILHFSNKFMESGRDEYAEPRAIPAAAKSSFSGSSTLPSAESDKGRINPCGATKSEKCSLGPGLVPQQVYGKESVRRLHSGKSSEQSFSLTERSVDVVSPHPRRRNNETLAPPDNLSRGLKPLKQFSIEYSGHDRRSVTAPGLSSLGPGLIPIPHRSEIFDFPVDEKESSEPVPFKRVYGINALI